MCSIVKTLGKQDKFRNITQCEHGTIHLNWYRSTLRILGKELPGIISFLEKSVTEDFKPWQNEIGKIELDGHGYYQIWLMGTGFYLSSDDFLLFVNLIHQASRTLELSQTENKDPNQRFQSFEILGQNRSVFSEN